MMELEPTTFCMASGSWEDPSMAGSRTVARFFGALSFRKIILKLRRFAADSLGFGH
jgi:hypothetical protein